mmetsp:Transcript_40791/g.74520  ORF Transcript_40791/g.74520 Transcript_40791/m.74520 type:complete len:570 (-) Transcript_40791:195-1904(-)
MEADFAAMLVTACTGVKGKVTREDFSAAIVQAATEAIRQTSASYVAKSIDDIIKACSQDSALDAKACLWVVNEILDRFRKASSASETSEVARFEKSELKRVLQALHPHLVSWLKIGIRCQKSPKGLQALQALVEKWQRKMMILTQHQADELLSVVKEQNSSVMPRQTFAVRQDSLQSFDSQASASSAPKAGDTDSQASTEASLQDRPPTVDAKRCISDKGAPQLSTSSIPGATAYLDASPAKRFRRTSGGQLTVSPPEAGPSQLLATQTHNRRESSSQIINEVSQPATMAEQKENLPSLPRPTSTPRESSSPVVAERSESVKTAKEAAGAVQKLTTPSKAAKRGASQPADVNSSPHLQTSTPSACSSDSKANATSSPSQAKQLKEGDPKSLAGGIPCPEIWKVYGDCRCLFRAVCRACDDPDNQIDRDAQGVPCAEKPRRRELIRADDLRAQVCVTMRKCSTEVEKMLGGEMDVEEYTRRMGEWQTWGDGICLKFLPDLISRPIQVYAFNIEKQCVFDSGIHMPREKSLHGEPAIVLWYNGKSHYDLVSTRWLMAWERSLYKTSEAESL